MLQFGIIPTSDFIYLVTNHACDAIKAIIRTVNMKSRKSETLTNLGKVCKCSNCPPWAFTQAHSMVIENKKNQFC